MVARLEDAGFVERVQDPTDRRVRLLQLSPGGVRRMREAYGPREDDVSKLLSKRPREELEPLAALLLELSATTQGHAGAVEREPPLAGANGAPVWRKWG